MFLKNFSLSENNVLQLMGRLSTRNVILLAFLRGESLGRFTAKIESWCELRGMKLNHKMTDSMIVRLALTAYPLTAHIHCAKPLLMNLTISYFWVLC